MLPDDVTYKVKGKEGLVRGHSTAQPAEVLLKIWTCDNSVLFAIEDCCGKVKEQKTGT